MESYLVTTLVADTTLKAFFLPRVDPAQWFFASMSLGKGPSPANPGVKHGFPWMAYGELPSQPFPEVRETSNAQIRNFQFFVYDEGGDFTIINSVLASVRRIVKAMPPFKTSDGVRCSDSEWLGFSGMLPADAYSGVCRFGTARFVVSQ